MNIASLISAAEAIVELGELDTAGSINVVPLYDDNTNSEIPASSLLDRQFMFRQDHGHDTSSKCEVGFPAHLNGFGSAESPIVLDSESEEEDDMTAFGPLASPISLSSHFSSREPSIFDTPPQSATSVITNNSFIPSPIKEVIDLTSDEAISSGSEGEGKYIDVEVIDVENIHSMDPQYFDDDIQMINPQRIPDRLSFWDFFSPEIAGYIDLMMNVEDASNLVQAIPWQPVVQTSAISRLPTEILSMIMEYTLSWFGHPDDESVSFHEKLTGANPLIRVCQRWRYLLLPKLLRSVTISECTFLTKSAHCQNCMLSAGKHLVSVPIVRSLFDGTATPEVTQLAEYIQTVSLSAMPCERRSLNGEDSLESGFVFFLPRVQTVVIPSNLVKNFMNGASAHGLNLDQKVLPNIRIHALPSSLSVTRRRPPLASDSIEADQLMHSWIIPEDIKRLEVDGDCLQMCTKMEMLLLEELTINRRSHGDKFIQPPTLSTLATLFSRYNTEFSTLSKVTIRWLPKAEPSFLASGSASNDNCPCVTLAGIPSLEYLDASAVCPLFFTKKIGKCMKCVAFEYPCVMTKTRPPPPIKYQEFRTLITSANEMRNRLILDEMEQCQVSTKISLISNKARDKPHTMDISLNTSPAYTVELGEKVVRVTEYSAKAATRYRLYINSLVARSTKAIMAREDKKLLSEYAIAARANSLTNRWNCTWTGPAPTAKKQRTTVLKWDYNVDLDVFLSGAGSGEFMVLGRAKDRLLNARETEERRAKKAEMERLKKTAPPKKRSRKRKQDTKEQPLRPDTQNVTDPATKKPKLDSGVVLPPISSLLPNNTAPLAFLWA
ncbi:hypothetical protein AA313_de0201736 [Arthrobotrys entomopaga]|nr:hypothetical protein AA313_de0201736 [Arthrobotrys entomopaga]